MRPAAVSEQDGHVPSRRAHVQARALHLRTDDEDVVVESRLDVRLGHRQPVDKPRALGSDVERSDRVQPQLLLHEHPGSREAQVGRECGEDDELDVLRRESRALDGHARRLHAKVGGARPRFHEPAFPDPRPLDDPLLRGVHHGGQFCVRYDAGRQCPPGSKNPRSSHRSPLTAPGQQLR
jgi:hypothetical protein